MGISIFPAATSSTLNGFTMVATAANTVYSSSFSSGVGVYTITCASGTIAKVEFYENDTYITTGTTSSGTVTVNIATAPTKIAVYTNTGTNINVLITKISTTLVNDTVSGTLDTITTVGTTTYTGTSASGYAYAVAVGGGGGGGNLGGEGNSGGGSGGAAGKLINLTGSMSVTVGAGGALGVNGSNTTIGTIVGGGGSKGGNGYTSVGGAGGVATGGASNVNGIAGVSQTNSTVGKPGGAATTTPYPFVIGTLTNGAGGTGTSSNGSGGTAGGNGIIYVLRF